MQYATDRQTDRQTTLYSRERNRFAIAAKTISPKN